MHRTVLTVAAAVATQIAIAPATATDHCVSCTAPAASYVCEVKGLADAAAAGVQGQLLCIKSLAAEGGHQTCSITRHLVAPCSGPLRIVYPSEALPPVPGAASDTNALRSAAPSAAPGPAGSATDPTVEPAPKSGLAKAGETFGRAAQKTWTCMSSMFKDC